MSGRSRSWDTVLASRLQRLLLLGDNIYAVTRDIDVMRRKYAKLAAMPSFQALRRLQGSIQIPTLDSRSLNRRSRTRIRGVRIMAATKLARVSPSRTDVAFKALGSLADDKDADVRSQMHHSLAILTPKPSRSSGQ